MKFFFDNNLSPRFPRGLKQLNDDHGVKEILALRDKFKQNEEDQVWLQKLSSEGGWFIVTQDRFTKGHLEKKAFSEASVATFLLSGWGKHTYWDQAHSLVKQWPVIVKVASKAKPGDVYKVGFRLSGKGFQKL